MPARRRNSRKRSARVKGPNPLSDEDRRRLQREMDMLYEIALRRPLNPLYGAPWLHGVAVPPPPRKPRRRGKDTRERLAANIAQHPNLSKRRRAQMLGVAPSTVIRALRELKPPPK